jgi:PKHD-type hydroxylase
MKTKKVVSINKKLEEKQSSDFTSTATSWPFELDPVHAFAYWDNAFTKDECEFLIKLGNSQKPKKGVVGSEGGAKTVYKENLDLRDSEVSWLYPCADNRWAFQRMTDILVELNNRYFKFDLFGATEGFQFTKYVAPTGHYGKHVDCAVNNPIRKLSFTLQLSNPDEYEGGDLCLYAQDEPIIANRNQGFITVFPSYVLHEVTPVTKGTRYSLVSWITGKPFK